LIDTVGVALGGSTEGPSGIVNSFVRRLGCRPVSGVVSGGFRTAAPEAAVANGVLAHVLDYDDNSNDAQSRGCCHHSGAFISALLPLAEETGSSGRDVVEAQVIGSEVWAKLSGVLYPPSLLSKGWHPTAVLGTIGATAAAAKLLGLDAEATQHALGLSCSQAAGVDRNRGSMIKAFHMGNAAKNAVTAAVLAGEGFTSTKNVMEAESGFFSAFSWSEGVDMSYIDEKLGSSSMSWDRG
jgi:2-methylcitrate dehydratase PrpD